MNSVALVLLFVAGASTTLAGFWLTAADTQLAVRMVLSLAIAATITGGVLVGLYLLLTTTYEIFVVAALAFTALGFLLAPGPPRRTRGRPVEEADVRRIESALQRLALVAAIAPPAAVVEPRRAPLSWTISAPAGRGAVHVTTGLLDRLDDPQLQAVAAHELGHLINHDATIMTLVAAWPTAYMRTMSRLWDSDGAEGDLLRQIGTLGYYLLPVAFLQLCSARLISRHRELVADRTAAHLIGSPATVAGALIALSEGMREMRDRDLRDVTPRDLFHFIPTHQPNWKPWATHPPLEERLAQLDRLERELQG